MRSIIESTSGKLSVSNTFIYGNGAEANNLLDQMASATVAVVLFTSTGTGVIRGRTDMARIEKTHDITVMIGSKSNFDESFVNRDINYHTPMQTLADEFMLRLNDELALNGLTEFTEFSFREVVNSNDQNLDGVELKFQLIDEYSKCQ